MYYFSSLFLCLTCVPQWGKKSATYDESASHEIETDFLQFLPF